MSIKWTKWVLDCSPARGSQRLALIALAERASEAEGWCWCGYDDIGARAKLKRRQSIRVVRQLAADGHIRVVPGGRGEGDCNGYIIVGDRDAATLDQLAARLRLLLDERLARFRGGRRVSRMTPLDAGPGGGEGVNGGVGRVTSAPGKGVARGAPRVTPATPEPSEEPVTEPRNRTQNDGPGGAAGSEVAGPAGADGFPRLNALLAVKVGESEWRDTRLPESWRIGMVLNLCGCDRSFHVYVGKVCTFEQVAEVAERYLTQQRRIKNPGGWWRTQLRKCGALPDGADGDTTKGQAGATSPAERPQSGRHGAQRVAVVVPDDPGPETTFRTGAGI